MDIIPHVLEKGSGEPLILLHGNGENSEYFTPQISYFSSYYRVIAIDSRGHGKTPRGTKPFTLVQFSEDLYDFLKERNILKATILGFSDGANIAIIFALKHPEMVSSLILNGGNIQPSGVKTIYQLPTVIEYAFTRKKEKKELLGLMVKEPHISPEELSNISCRTLVIAGTRDMIKERHTKLIAQSIPSAELVLISGNHFISSENSEEFNKAVAKFLKI